jgi:predicted secreted protein
MRFKMMVLAAATSFSLPALAQTETPAPKPEKKICRRDQVIGSYLGSKPICHTKTEWQKIDQANGDDAERTLDRDRQRQNSRVSPGG